MVNYFTLLLRTTHSPRLSIQGQCILCAANAQNTVDMCLACEDELPFLGPNCYQCALPLNDLSEQYCGQCLRSPPPFKRSEAIWLYQPPIAQLITSFKYNNCLSYGNYLSKVASKKIASAYIQTALPDCICPIPMHWRRRIIRGFNQSHVIAKILSTQLNIPLVHHLIRCQATTHQQGLNAKQRHRNLQNAFKVSGDVKGKIIAVVDDVMTTGATAIAVSHCLLDAGAAEVHIWCLARTPH